MARVSAAAERSFAFAVGRERRIRGRVGAPLARMRRRLRRTMGYAGPIAAALILIVVAGAVTWRLERSRTIALEVAARLLDLSAGELAHKLDRDFGESPKTDPQLLLTQVLSRDSDDFGAALLVDAQGVVRAAWPDRGAAPATLAEALGGDALLPLFGDKAGAMPVTGPDGVDSFAALRTLGGGRGQIALIASERAMLAGWRANARVLTALLASVVL